MSLQTLMQAGPAMANELFAKLSQTSDGTVETREKLFAELKAELELHTGLEEQHLFPIPQAQRRDERDRRRRDQGQREPAGEARRTRGAAEER